MKLSGYTPFSIVKDIVVYIQELASIIVVQPFDELCCTVVESWRFVVFLCVDDFVKLLNFFY